MADSFKVEISPELASYLEEQPEKQVTLLLVLELYRENKVTLRQAAEILSVSYRQMQEILAEHEVFIEFSPEDLEEEINYGRRGE